MHDDDDFDRDAILARRKRFIAAALSGIAISQASCAQPQACLSYAPPPDAVDADSTAEDTSDATPMPCLSPKPQDTGLDSGRDASTDIPQPPRDMPPSRDATPMPCLTPLPADVTLPRDATPMPCLTPPPPDVTLPHDAAPMPCLSPLPPDGG